MSSCTKLHSKFHANSSWTLI